MGFVVVRCLIRSVILSCHLLVLAAARPAVADSTFSDSSGTSVTLRGDGTVSFACKGASQLAPGQETYLVCVDGSPTGLSATGVVTPASTSVAPNQRITASVTATLLGGRLGVTTTLSWTGGTCVFDVKQRIFNQSSNVIRITQYKRVANVDVDGDRNNTFVGGSTTLTVLAGGAHTVILSGGGITNATTALAYSAPSLRGELNCGTSSGFSRLRVTGDRVLAVLYNFQPGQVLSPAGQSNSDMDFSVRYTVQ